MILASSSFFSSEIANRSDIVVVSVVVSAGSLSSATFWGRSGSFPRRLQSSFPIIVSLIIVSPPDNCIQLGLILDSTKILGHIPRGGRTNGGLAAGGQLQSTRGCKALCAAKLYVEASHFVWQSCWQDKAIDRAKLFAGSTNLQDQLIDRAEHQLRFANWDFAICMARRARQADAELMPKDPKPYRTKHYNVVELLGLRDGPGDSILWAG